MRTTMPIRALSSRGSIPLPGTMSPLMVLSRTGTMVTTPWTPRSSTATIRIISVNILFRPKLSVGMYWGYRSREPTPRMSFNFHHYDAPAVLNVTVNGNAHSVPWPYPDRDGWTWRTFAVEIPITDLVEGTDVVTIGADTFIATSNVNIVFVNGVFH